MKKITAVIIVALIIGVIVALLIFSLCAPNKDETDSSELVASELTYKPVTSESEKYYVVTGAKDKNITDLVIPSYHNNHPVKEIEKKAFADYKIKSVYIARTIEKIGEEAFLRASELVSVTFAENNNLKEIGRSCFRLCDDLLSIDLSSCANLIELPDGAFFQCSDLTYIHLPKNLKIIGRDCFMYTACDYLLMYKKVEEIGINFCRTQSEGMRVYYFGTKDEWKSIELKGYFHYTLYTYSETSSNQSWHFVNGKPVIW